MKNLKLLLGFILAIAILVCCNKDEDYLSDYCFVTWSKLEDSRNPVLLPAGTWWHPRILGNRIWYSSSKNVAGVSWEDGSVTVVPRPQGMNIYNPDQRDVSFAGTDRSSLFYFDWENSLWKTLYSAPSGSEIDDDLDSEIMEGLLPFVQKNTADNAQRVWLYEFADERAYEVEGLSKLYEERPFKIYTQPKVFVNGGDTLLATVVQFDTESNRSVLVFSLKEEKINSELMLGYGQYRDAFRLGDKLGIRYFYSFYHDAFTVIDPKEGQLLWDGGACIWLSCNGDLFSLDCLFGFNRKVNLQTGKTDYFFPAGNDLFSLDGLIDGNYVIPGLMTKDTLSGPLNHIVFVNREKGCEVKRLPMPGQSVVFGKLTCFPDSNWVIAQDEKRFVHFLRLR
jgi:hypothetical protein